VRNRGILIQFGVPFWILALWTMIWLANSITWLSTCRCAPVTMASLTHLLSTCRHVQLMTMASLGYMFTEDFHVFWASPLQQLEMYVDSYDYSALEVWNQHVFWTWKVFWVGGCKKITLLWRLMLTIYSEVI
jgi:hypothetical protein